MQQYNELTNTEINDRIRERIHSKRDRHILRLKLIDGLTYEKIAEIIGMTPRQIQNIVRFHKNCIYAS